MLGTGLGALTGAVIGHGTGHTEGGAIIGGVVGGMAGSLAGQSEDVHDERTNAIRQASHQRVLANSLTNNDVTMMSVNQVGDQVIVNSIKTRGGIFDLSPNGIIALKQQGVSDQVIQAMQDSVQNPQVSIAPPVYRETEVIVTPSYSLYPHWDSGYHSYHHSRHFDHCGPPRRRSGLHIHGEF